MSDPKSECICEEINARNCPAHQVQTEARELWIHAPANTKLDSEWGVTVTAATRNMWDEGETRHLIFYEAHIEALAERDGNLLKTYSAYERVSQERDAALARVKELELDLASAFCKANEGLMNDLQAQEEQDTLLAKLRDTRRMAQDLRDALARFDTIPTVNEVVVRFDEWQKGKGST